MATRRLADQPNTKTKRNTTTIELTDEAMEKLDGYVKRLGGMRGMKKHILSQLVEWFAGASDAEKSKVTGIRLVSDTEAKRDPVGVIR